MSFTDTEWYGGDTQKIARHKEIELRIIEFANHYQGYDGDRDILKNHLVIFFEIALNRRGGDLSNFEPDLIKTKEALLIDFKMLTSLVDLLNFDEETRTKLVDIWKD